METLNVLRHPSSSNTFTRVMAHVQNTLQGAIVLYRHGPLLLSEETGMESQENKQTASNRELKTEDLFAVR